MEFVLVLIGLLISPSLSLIIVIKIPMYYLVTEHFFQSTLTIVP